MPYDEDELLPISALQHLLYCERQAALIHVEQVWLDNVWTVEGNHLHETVTSGLAESRGETRVTRDMPLRSLVLGLTGRADVVEFHRGEASMPGSVAISRWPGNWMVVPVEYKRGRPKGHRADEVQVCAQAMCLEEMLGATISEGALFYGQTRRRLTVTFDAELRAVTAAAARRFREIFDSRTTPEAVYEAHRCDECSLIDVCKPKAARKDVAQYLRSALRTSAGDASE